MWYSIAKKEFNFKDKKHLIGSVWVVAKGPAGMVSCCRLEWTPEPTLSPKYVFTCDKEDARKMFTTPEKSLDAVLEESINYIEGSYC